MSEPLAENVPYVGGPMDGKSCRLLYCESESVCMADATHYYRLVRVKGSGVATLMYAGWISTKEAATMSDDAELSVASAGSVLVDIVDRLCGWRDEHGFPTPGEIMDEAVSEIRQLRGSLEWHKETLVEAEEKMVRMQLTDAERTAIEHGIASIESDDDVFQWGPTPYAATLRALLQRTK